MGSVVVVAPRVDDVVSLDRVKTFLRVDSDDHDNLITALIDTAVDHLDGPAGVLGLALAPQTLRFAPSSFDWRTGALVPIGPAVDLVSVSFLEASGAWTNAPEGAFGLDATNRVRWLAGSTWPAGAGPISITYTAGYAVGAVPATITTEILLHVKILYDQPEGSQLEALNRCRRSLRAPVRRWRV